ncbi:hypothetical protein BROUX41_003278 [Berkeleyomyces rouxiae]|uniref:uncharacterized protein n=1 Tax=Berkeleyomyces rouxiae TaxID=2035830 RepID=UPI003B787221
MSFVNKYTARRVADASSKGCDICYKATTTVLFSDSPEGKDFFYVCPVHLKDRKFCSPIVDPEAEKARIEARTKKEVEAEIEKLKEEYAAKKKAKEEKDKDKDKEKGKKDGIDTNKKDEEKKNDDDDKKASSGENPPTTPEEPRVFALVQTFFDLRKQKRRDLELAKRQHQQSQLNRERMARADFWPTVPGEQPRK